MTAQIFDSNELSMRQSGILDWLLPVLVKLTCAFKKNNLERPSKLFIHPDLARYVGADREFHTIIGGHLMGLEVVESDSASIRIE